MYYFPYSAAVLMASFLLSHARTVFISHNGEHSYLPSASEPGVCMKPECVIAASDILTSLDETVDPCDDFYRFACGGWLKRQETSEKERHIGIIKEMQNRLDLRLKDLLESEYESSDPPFVKMLKDFYNSCTDLDSIEKKGSEPLKTMLSRLGGWPVVEGDKWDESTFDWVDSLISIRKLGFDHKILFPLDVDAKSHSDTVYIIVLNSPGGILPWYSNLGLGVSDENIAAFFKLLIKAAKLLGADETTAEKELLEVVNFMIALENSKVPERERVVEKNFEYRTVKELQEEVPQVPWMKFFNGLLNETVYENDTVFVESKMVFVTKLADLLTSTKKRVIANYMMLRVVLQFSIFLSEEWNNIDKEVKKFQVYKENTRWEICRNTLMDGMDKALSSYYVRHYFKDESKDEAMILVKYIQREFLKLLEENDWMDDKTREKAEEKARAIKSYIGYPKELLNDTYMMKIYENLTITTDSLFENVLSLKKFSTDEHYSKYRKYYQDLNILKFTYITKVNAFYSPHINCIGVPAGILHDVLYEKERPNYMNFGGIGFIIGHEITHGFDNDGRQFDKDGAMINWWDEESDKHYRKKVQCIIDQYDNYTLDNGWKVNAHLTQNENIADNGGLKEAYRAYQSWTKDNGIEPMLPALDYTQNQLFWLSAAHAWCSKSEPETLKLILTMDPHSPDQYRIIGPMSNLEEFSKDFKCSADSPMNRKYKCKVW